MRRDTTFIHALCHYTFQAEDEFPDTEPRDTEDFLPQLSDDDETSLSHFHDWRESEEEGDELSVGDINQRPQTPPSSPSELATELDDEAGFDTYDEPTRNHENTTLSRPLRLTYPLTNFKREEIIAAFSSLKIRYSVSDNILLEIFHILNRMRDPFTSQRPLPETRYAVTRYVSKKCTFFAFNCIFDFIRFIIFKCCECEVHDWNEGMIHRFHRTNPCCKFKSRGRVHVERLTCLLRRRSFPVYYCATINKCYYFDMFHFLLPFMTSLVQFF
jgi:hypothetical protein